MTRWRRRVIPIATALMLVSAAYAAAAHLGQPPEDDWLNTAVVRVRLDLRGHAIDPFKQVLAVDSEVLPTAPGRDLFTQVDEEEDVEAGDDRVQAGSAQRRVKLGTSHVAQAPQRTPPPVAKAPAQRPQRAMRPVPISPAPVPVAAVPRRIRVRLATGRTVVARVHGSDGGNLHVILPDGQLGIPDVLAYSDEPFVPAAPQEIADEMLGGPFAGFRAKITPHYVIIFQSDEEFADESGRVLENLYKGLSDAFHRRDFPVTESEFPLVAVIFRTERDFRAYKRVDPEIQAYYELYTNRIYFYQTSERDERAPEVAALRRPQTVAHEGTHQILQNIGIQPRLAAWPPWLIEGLAEYCSTPVTSRRGTTTWAGLGYVSADHMATIRDLDDPLSGQVEGGVRPEHIGRPPRMPLVEYLATKTELTPTDYALAWGMTHYLAQRRVDDFVRYLKQMSTIPPLANRTPEDHLIAFRAAFGSDLGRLDREIGSYLGRLRVNQVLPYYAVLFQQRVPGGSVKRAAIISQSPSMIRQWLDTVTSPRGELPIWDATPFTSRTPALVTAEQWVRGE